MRIDEATLHTRRPGGVPSASVYAPMLTFIVTYQYNLHHNFTLDSPLHLVFHQHPSTEYTDYSSVRWIRQI